MYVSHRWNFEAILMTAVHLIFDSNLASVPPCSIYFRIKNNGITVSRSADQLACNTDHHQGDSGFLRSLSCGVYQLSFELVRVKDGLQAPYRRERIDQKGISPVCCRWFRVAPLPRRLSGFLKLATHRRLIIRTNERAR